LAFGGAIDETVASMTPGQDAILGMVLLATVAMAIAAALRAMGVGGAALLGGAIAGVLLGPTLLGRVLPTAHERAFVGAVEQRREVMALELERLAWQRAIVETDASLIDAHRLSAEAEWRDAAIHAARADMKTAEFAHRRWLRFAAIGLGTFVVIGAGWPRPSTRSSSATDGGGWAIGAFSAVIAGAAGVGTAMLIGLDPLGPGALACAAALAVGPWRLSWRDLRIARGAEVDGPATMIVATRTAAVIAATILLAATFATDAGRLPGRDAAALAAVAIMLGIGLATMPRLSAPAGVRLRRAAALAGAVAIASVAALATVRIELLLDARLWPLLILPIVTGDGRWLGGMVAALLLGGRGPGVASRLLLVLSAAGPTQVAMAAIGLWTELLPPTLALGLVVGAVLVELTGPVRRRAERTLREAESWRAESGDQEARH